MTTHFHGVEQALLTVINFKGLKIYIDLNIMIIRSDWILILFFYLA